MIKILFVCHGNICRSPMAEFIMRDLVDKKGYRDRFYIASAATSIEEIGNGVYPPVKRILNRLGIDCSQKRAVQVKYADYENYDYIVCMDSNNINNLRRIIPQDKENKISQLMDFTDNPHSVADPWYTGDFEKTLSDITLGTSALFKKIKAEFAL